MAAEKTENCVQVLTQEEQYEECKRLIYDRAWSWSRTTGMDYEELIAEGNLVFCECWAGMYYSELCEDYTRTTAYDRSKSKFSTYLYQKIDQRFSDVWRKYKDQTQPIVLCDDVAAIIDATFSYNPNYAHFVTFSDALMRLSRLDKKVVSIALSGSPSRRRTTKNWLIADLRSRGFNLPKCKSCFARIRKVLKDVDC